MPGSSTQSYFPPLTNTQTYGTWTQYSNDTEAIAKGRGPGRLSRRRKRLAAQRERELSKRQQRVARRHVGKEAMAAREAELAHEHGYGSDATAKLAAERAARLARLAELRAKLGAGASAVRA